MITRANYLMSIVVQVDFLDPHYLFWHMPRSHHSYHPRDTPSHDPQAHRSTETQGNWRPTVARSYRTHQSPFRLTMQAYPLEALAGVLCRAHVDRYHDLPQFHLRMLGEFDFLPIRWNEKEN